MKFEIKAEVDEQMVQDLACTGWEGGINYWVDFAEHNSNGIEFEYLWELPFLGGAVTIHPGEGEDPVVLDGAALQRGLQVMADKYPQHWGNFVGDCADAETGDVFIQCCCFGEIVFG